MNRKFEHQVSGPGNNSIIEDKLVTALDALQPGEHRQKVSLFSQAYPSIVRAIARQVPQKEILATLSRNGLKLHPVRYREMLEAERKSRDEDGKMICCLSCGSEIVPQATASMSSQLGSADTNKVHA
jgi:hypothetical protein